MSKKEKIPTTTYLMWAIIAVALLKNIKVPHGDEITIGTYYPQPFYLNDFIYFLGNDIILLLFAAVCQKLSHTIISWVLVALAIGKILDEFASPFGYWYGELFWDVGIVVWAIWKWVKVNREWR